MVGLTAGHSLGYTAGQVVGRSFGAGDGPLMPVLIGTLDTAEAGAGAQARVGATTAGAGVGSTLMMPGSLAGDGSSNASTTTETDKACGEIRRLFAFLPIRILFI